MHPLLVGPNLKLDRARDHLVDLSNRIRAFLDPPPYEISTKLDPKTGITECKLKVLRDPPQELSVVIGDAVHNLRSALDHLYCALIRNNGGTCEPEKHAPSFPLLSDRKKFDSLRPSPAELVGQTATLVEEAQPYNAGNDDSVLYQLNVLSRIDKHRVLLTGANTISEAEMNFVPVGGSHRTEGGWLRGPYEDGAVLGRWQTVVDPPRTEMKVSGKVSLTVGFGDGSGPATGAPVIDMLRGCLDHIEGIVDSAELSFVSWKRAHLARLVNVFGSGVLPSKG